MVEYNIDYFRNLFEPLMTLQIGDKLTINDNSITVDRKSFYQGMCRWYNGANKENSRDYFYNLLKKYELFLNETQLPYSDAIIEMNIIISNICNILSSTYKNTKYEPYYANLSVSFLSKNYLTKK